MNIGPFATIEEAIEWGNQFASGIGKGVEMFAEEAGQAATTQGVTESYHPNEYAICQIEEISAVIATIRRSLSALIPELRDLVDVDHEHTQPVTAAVFMLDSLENKLDEVNLYLMPVEALQKARREMAAANRPKKK